MHKRKKRKRGRKTSINITQLLNKIWNRRNRRKCRLAATWLQRKQR